MLRVIPRSEEKVFVPKTFICDKDVFDVSNKTGSKVIHYLFQLNEKYGAATAKFINLNQPTVEAYNAEVDLVDGIKMREARMIGSKALRTIVDHYIKTHDPNADLSQPWTKDEVQLIYLELFLNAELLDAYTCNEIQGQIITALWQTTHPEASVEYSKL